MKAIFLPVLLLSFALSPISPAQTCREVVRDASGRIVQTIERQKQAGGTERAVIRDASGRLVGTATTQASGGSTSQTQYRDASGRLAGSAVTNGYASGSSRTTYRDASGRMAEAPTPATTPEAVVTPSFGMPRAALLGAKPPVAAYPGARLPPAGMRPDA